MPATLTDLLQEAVRERPERAGILGSGDATVNLRALGARADAVAARLGGAAPGERVGLLLTNHSHFPALFFGILRTSAPVVLLSPSWSRRELAEAIADAGVERVLTHRVHADALAGLARACPLDGAARWPAPAREVRDVAGDPDADAVVVFTAATGGRARGARLTHGGLVANARATVAAAGFSEADVVLAALPWTHVFGLVVTLAAPLAAGAAVVPVERFQPRRVLEIGRQTGATVLAGVPGMFAALVQAAGAGPGPPLPRLRLAICGGASLPRRTARTWEARFGVPLRQGYGLTEAGPVCLFNRADRPNRIGSLGGAFPGMEVSVRDPDGSELPQGEVGELCVRGDALFAGYLGEDRPQPGGFHGDWLRTGDLGRRDGDGHHHFQGMLKPMFTRNGFNVYPREVERALAEDPRIAEVRVCGAPDPDRETEIVLDVRATSGARLAEEEVRRICRERLAAYKQPGRIRIVE